ncbi:MAG: hypothetical protein ABGU93_13230 [Acetobacterium sp.]|uniref:hypothetical protein n=2 Tax=Acetobacterium sp. TaxID=1872094 RepID=UPI003241FF69
MIIIILVILIILANDLGGYIYGVKKIDLAEEYSRKYNNIKKYPTSSSLESQLFKMKSSYKTKTHELLKNMALLYVFLGLFTIGYSTLFETKIRTSILPDIFIKSLTGTMSFLLSVWGWLPIFILYLLIRKALGIDEKKDAKLEIEKDCINEALIRRKSEECSNQTKL